MSAIETATPTPAATESPASTRRLSIVIPSHNEADNVVPLYEEIADAVAREGLTAEVLFVDDGSTDETYARLRELHGRWEAGELGEAAPRVRVLKFRRRFGKAAGLAAGFAHAQGDVVFTMDGDLQDNPKEIPRFLEALDQGYGMVSGWKQKRHDPPSKTVPSKLFNWVVSQLSGIHIHDFNCGFKVYRGELSRQLCLYGDMHRYIPVLAKARGYETTEIVVEHRPRTHGRSKYGAKRLITGFLDLLTVLMLTRFAQRPMQFFGAFGLLGWLAAAGSWALALPAALLGGSTAAATLVTVGAVFAVGGVLLMGLGLVADLTTRARLERGIEATYDVETTL